MSVLAVGAWLKNAACLLRGGEAVWSPLHGDLSDPAACAALEASLQRLVRQAGPDLCAIAHDLHPDFFSTRLAVELAARLGVPAVGVQHHHAHVAAVLAEHRFEGPVIGLALDGVGLGTDGGAWGGELLWLHGAAWQRLGHVFPLALPGGDRAAREPWRMAASALFALGRGDEIENRFSTAVGVPLARGVAQMLKRQLNCPATSSTGRWFDAASAALGLCLRQHDEAQAAIVLQNAATRALVLNPAQPALDGAVIDDHNRLDLRGVWAQLLDLAPERVDAAAAGFHLALAESLVVWAATAAGQRGTTTVALGGGCFFNAILREQVVKGLMARGLSVLQTGAAGCGDAGLALGQAWVAAQQRSATTTLTTKKETETCV